ncbi:MAG: peptidylprolyl isomerase [Ignavibacteriales bacterium]|nr:peptidylprolyl isomerase [Ignavibacteriales bacterium]
MNYKNIFCISLFVILAISCSSSNSLLKPDTDDLIKSAPQKFNVVFETTKGTFTIEVDRENSPLAVDRFFYLVNNSYYDGNRFFRVVPKFVVQWGMKGIPQIDSTWENMGIKDEPVKLSNTKGTIAFARSGPNTRSNQLYINLEDNVRLDSSKYNNVNGFPAFGKVINGMSVIESINSEYEQNPDQDSIMTKGNNYLNKNFPKLDYIISTNILTK